MFLEEVLTLGQAQGDQAGENIYDMVILDVFKKIVSQYCPLIEYHVHRLILSQDSIHWITPVTSFIFKK